MLKELINVWKGKEPLFEETVDDFGAMFATSHEMFEMVTRALFEGKTLENLKKEIYKKDAQVNSTEQNIRRKIVTQLSGGAEEPIAACLILMSISKDAERIGDYTKNILEVFEIKPKLEEEAPFYPRLVELKNKISELFVKVAKAYHGADKDAARELVKDSYAHQQICDQNVEDLLLAPPKEDHVAYALLTRFFKRILAHQANIATSIYMPVTKIDFFDEKRLAGSAR